MAVEMLVNTKYLVPQIVPLTDIQIDERDARFNLVYKGVEEQPTVQRQTSAIQPAPIHDLESFFWVLCWTCVMREGPSTIHQTANAQGHEAVIAGETIFQSKDPRFAALEKRYLLSNNIQFSSWIKENIAPYFY